ncbi:hypothetical protein [Sphingomonas sp. M1-B02]|uniref:hypothetical protein n=1 Tax=Sphingomonas sp. M1-B02 TaxID=3114300 RepID=UPI002240BA92|nr:hypothetical protein [Sphingomonas sp. S6-11]UZK65200.1 hypothetical protein OKW87_11820 [Sphingomonas sp. S6-11]
MTLIERIASAIAASRTGTTAGWQFYRGDAARMLAATRGFPTLCAPHMREVREDCAPRAG